MKILLLTSLLTAVTAAFPLGSERVRELLDAIRKGDHKAVRKLLEIDPSLVNSRGSDGVPAVRLAMYYRQSAIARRFIERGARLDIYDAAATGELKRLRDLVSGDRKLVNSYSTDGATPLGLAAFFGQRDAVEFLLDHGAGIDILSTNPAFPLAPLHSAMSGGHKEIFDLLLARGADIRVREGGGMTVLHEAAGLGNLEYVQRLLEGGADPAAKTDDGKLPEDFALARNHRAVAAVLSQARR